MFFFSSRRRHTRCSRDWSSDVCSSDLEESSKKLLERFHHRKRERGRDAWGKKHARTRGPSRRSNAKTASSLRSEERRVGKSVDLGGRRIIKKKKKKEKDKGRIIDII